jgi:dTDP-4-amino-4,6-dideoxygalactose transaminase
MQFIDLAAQQKRIRQKIENNILNVLDHGRYIMGPEITELEKKLAEFCHADYAVGVGSGTDALLMSLMALDIGAGDAVFTTDFTFIATAEVIQLTGAWPVLVDIDPDTYNISPDALQEAVEAVVSQGKFRPRAVIPVDIFGQCADYQRIRPIAEKYHLTVIQDAAQSFGASTRGIPVGCQGDIAATSFFPAKPLGAYGDAGMVFTCDREIYQRLLSIRIHGMGADKYENVRVGLNGRLDSMQAAVLLAKFDIFPDEIRLRQEVADRYSRGLGPAFKTPEIRKHNQSAWAQYSIEHPQRDRIIEKLREKGIPTAIYYKIPLHQQKVFQHLGYRPGDFPVSESVAQRIFSLPMHPYLESADQDRIIDLVNRC